MAKDRKFIKEKIYKDKTVESIFEELHNDFTQDRSDINEMINYFYETHKLEKGEMLQSMETTVKMWTTKQKGVDNMIKILAVLQKSVASEQAKEGKSSDETPYMDTMESLLKEINGN